MNITRIRMTRTWLLAACIFGILGNLARATEPSMVTAEYRALVPHRLLALLHATEVQRELDLSAEQTNQLETWFRHVDGDWFRTRIEKPEAQWPHLDRIEAEARQWMEEHLRRDQRDRMIQIEWQSLGPRMVLRSDVATRVKISPRQQSQFADVARASEELRRRSQASDATPEIREAFAKAIERETDRASSLLTPRQRRECAGMVGEAFDTSSLKRIYPMAPEFIEVQHWLNSEALTLESLRGRVVLVHFYAFQCHNCHANFPIYQRWHRELQKRGVVVIGIQTPETPRERVPEEVRKAAVEARLEFPILVDIESKNWEAWANTMWPTVYVVDKRGYLRHWWQGELNWQGATGDKAIEQAVEAALAEDY